MIGQKRDGDQRVRFLKDEHMVIGGKEAGNIQPHLSRARIAAKGSQVIVSTQSVNLIDNFEPEDVIAVDREDNQSVFRRLNSEDLKDWLEDYTLGDLWNKNVFGARP